MSSPRNTLTGKAWDPPGLDVLQAILPQYEFQSLIGRGGMGAVYKAIQRSLRRPVAIKILPTDLLEDSDTQLRARFSQEALNMAGLTHPGIVSVFEAGEVDNLLFIVMEFVDGTDLAHRIATEGRVTPDQVSRWMIQVCEALDYAHRRGIVHRDLKPANLLLTLDGKIKIADFGLALQIDHGRTQLTRTNVVLGTADFIAPEALSPGTKLDGRADIYALGVTLYQALTGEIPRGLWESASQRAFIDPAFDEVIERSMDPDRDRRYASSLEFARDLEAIGSSGPTWNPGTASERRRPPASGAPWSFRNVPPLWLGLAAIGAAVAAGFQVPLPRSWIEPTRNPVPPPFHLILDGTNQYVRIPTNAVPVSGDFTIECWLKLPKKLHPNLNTILSQAREPDWPRFYLGIWPTGEVWVGDAWARTGAIVPRGSWHHLALVRDTSDTRIYVDGVLRARHGAAIPNPGAAAWTDIGQQFDNRREFLEGGVGELRIWNTARSEDSIRADSGKSFHSAEHGLVARYAFDEKSGADVFNHGSGGKPMTARLIQGPRRQKTQIADAAAPPFYPP